MEKELLSIRDFAKLAGKSRQAVYAQLPTALKDYTEEHKGQKYIRAVALNEVYELGLDIDSQIQSLTEKKDNDCKPSEPKKNQDTDSAYVQSLLQQIDFLKQQITVKDSQIDKLNQSIETLNASFTTALTQQQALHMQQLKQIEDKQAEAEQVPEQEAQERKSGIFSKIFKKK